MEIRWRPVALSVRLAAGVATVLGVCGMCLGGVLAAESNGLQGKLEGAAPCAPRWECVHVKGDELANAEAVQEYVGTGIPGVIGNFSSSGTVCRPSSSDFDFLPCITFTGLEMYSMAHGAQNGYLCASKSAYEWAAVNAVPCAVDQRNAILISETAFVALESVAGSSIFIIIVLTASFATQWVLFLFSNRITSFTVESTVIPVSHLVFYFSALIGALALAYEETVREAVWSCQDDWSNSSLFFLATSGTPGEPVSVSLSDVVPAICSNASQVRLLWTWTASISAVALLLLFLIVLTRSQLDNKDDNKVADSENKDDDMAGEKERRRCSSYSVPLTLFISALIVIGTAVANFNQSKDFITYFAYGFGVSLEAFVDGPYAIPSRFLLGLFLFGSFFSICVAALELIRIAGCYSRLTRENMAKLVKYSVFFLSLSVLLSLIFFLVSAVIAVVGVSGSVGCSFIYEMMIQRAINSVFKVDLVKDWMDSTVQTAADVARDWCVISPEELDLGLDDSVILTRLLGFFGRVKDDLPQLNASVVPIFELRASVSKECMQLVDELIVPTGEALSEATYQMLTGVQPDPERLCSDLSGFGLDLECTTKPYDWCQTYGSPLQRASFGVLSSSLVLHLALIVVLVVAPLTAQSYVNKVTSELQKTEAAVFSSQPQRSPNDSSEETDPSAQQVNVA